MTVPGAVLGPGRFCGLGSREGSGVDRCSEDVLFAGEGDPVGAHVVGATCLFDTPGAGAGSKVLGVFLWVLGEQLAHGLERNGMTSFSTPIGTV